MSFNIRQLLTGETPADPGAGRVLIYGQDDALMTWIGGAVAPAPIGTGAGGTNGWSPVFAVATDGARRVLQVADWTGGTGTKPTTGQYVGAAGLTGTIGSAVDIRGAAGAAGSTVAVLDEGSSLTAAAASLNFTGAGVTASTSGAAVTVNIPGGGGSASNYSRWVFDPPVKDGSVDYTAELEALIRQANGLATDGTGTISTRPEYVFCAPGRYLLRALNPSATPALSTTTNSGAFVNGNNTLTLADASAFATGSNNVAKVYTDQGVYEGRFSRTAGSNTITFVPGQTGASLAGMTWSTGARVEQVGLGLSILLTAEPGTVTFLNYCNESAILNAAARNTMTANTVRKTVRSLTIGAALDWFPGGDDTICSILNIDDTSLFSPGDIVVINSGNPLPYNTDDRAGEAFRVMNVDGTNLYCHGVLEYHHYYEAFGSTTVTINKISEQVRVDLENLNFEGAPTLLGIDTINPKHTGLNADGSPNNVFGPGRAVSISVSGTTATVTTSPPHGLVPFVSSPRVDGNKVYIYGASASGLNIHAQVLTTPSSTTFTYTVSGVTAGTYSANYAVVADCHSGITEGRVLSLTHAPYARLRNCEARYPWAAFVRVAYCPFARIDNCGYANAGNALSSTNAKARLGYGVYCYGWSTGVVVSGGTWVGGRHLFTTAASSITSPDSTSWLLQGQPTLCVVENTVSIDSYGVPYDTHEEASGISFQNVIAINPARGHDGGSYAGAGGHIRCRRTRIINYYQFGGQQGIRYRGDAENRVVAEPKHRPVSTLRPTALTWPLSGATVPLFATEGFATGTNPVLIEQSPGSGIFIACTYTGRTVSGGNVSLTGVSSAGAGTGSLSTGAIVMQPNISSITISGSTATVTTTASHGFITGQSDVIVRIRGADQAGYNVTAVATITGASTFTYTIPATNDNNQAITAPTVSATTTSALTWQDWSQYPTHILKDATFEQIVAKENAVHAIVIEDCTNALKTEVRASGIVLNNVSRGIYCGSQTRLHLADIVASRVRDRLLETNTGAYANIGIVQLDASRHQGFAMVPFYLSGTAPQVHVASLFLTFGRSLTNAATPNPLSIFGGGGGAYTVSLGDLKLRDAYTASLSAATCPTVLPTSGASTFTFTGGGQQLYLPAQDNVVTNTLKTLGQRGHVGKFLLARPLAISDGNAVGNITVDVLRAGSSVLGATKMTIPAGSASSAAGTAATLSATTALIDTDASLTFTAQSASGAETAKLNGVALLGYPV